jgi:hypothetical protein
VEDAPLGAGDVVEIAGERLEIVVASEELFDTYRTRPVWPLEEDGDETFTKDRMATLDMVEVLMDTREGRDRTIRCVRTTLDDLLDQAGIAAPKLSPADVERMRQLADRLVHLCPGRNIEEWRSNVDRRLEQASAKAG